MEPDFSGYATKAGLKCTDGRTIMPGAFKHQDQERVPLVWQHGHSDPENVLGHAILENRDDGVYAYGFFNSSPKAVHSKGLVEHGDVTMLSIWANQLVERAGRVLHGAIREVSLVLSGANPGALIESVTIRHADGTVEDAEDEAIIYSGTELETGPIEEPEKAEAETDEPAAALAHADPAVDPQTNPNSDDETIQDVYDSMSQKQKDVLHFMVGQAIEAAQEELAQSDIETPETNASTDDSDEEGTQMSRNVFEKDDSEAVGASGSYVLSHSDLEGIVADASKRGSLKDAVEDFALAHGITDIDILFPDARALEGTPEFLSRRTEWVGTFLSGTRKSPFSRIKTLSADITVEEARAKGYVTGEIKKEEFFGVTKRVTIPTTVYKKQKLDRDDMVDITDFDIVAWLKAEMRLMLDEELARAALIGDGRDVANEDKINEQNIRPIATDHELYVTTVTVNTTDASSTVQEVIDAIVQNRRHFKGSGIPTLFTTETVIAQFLLLKDTLGRRIYKSLDEVAAELRVDRVVPVEVMEEDPTLLAIIVNPADYVFGATAGGEVSMFDDFDIDYNQYKYLIETRCCGTLVRLKSAIVVRSADASTDVAVTPNDPTFNDTTGVVTIVATTGVVYKNADTGATLSTGAQPALAVGDTLNVRAVADATHFIPSSADSFWTFTNFE
jgi:HK97 family phage prohead protease